MSREYIYQITKMLKDRKIISEQAKEINEISVKNLLLEKSGTHRSLKVFSY